MNWLLVGIGGFIGAVLRYVFNQILGPYSNKIPFATLTVNVIGSLLFGILLGSEIEKTEKLLYLFLAGGFLGSFTTFSTFTYETLLLFNQKELIKLFLYTGLHLIIGIGMALIGYYLPYLT